MTVIEIPVFIEHNVAEHFTEWLRIRARIASVSLLNQLEL